MTRQEKINAAVQRQFNKAAMLSRFMATHPELSNEEFEASKHITAALKDAGFALEYPFGGLETAFRGTLSNGAGEKAAFVVEYDALPVIGHGCGHNLHGALSVLAGLAMLDLKDEFCGTIYVIGTPAEEREGRKIDLAAQGVFDGLCFAGMMHCSSGGISQCVMATLGISMFDITFTGKSSHAAAAPWDGISALACARKFIDLMDARRECWTPDMHFNAIFTEGGTAPNVIPEKASLNVDFRADCRERMEKMEEIMRKCANGAALAMDCKVSIERVGGEFAAMKRAPVLEDKMREFMEAHGIPVKETTPPLGSTDMANVSWRCPTVHPLISIADKFIPWHTSEFAAACQTPEAEEIMKRGAAALVDMALWCMENPQLINQK